MRPWRRRQLTTTSTLRTNPPTAPPRNLTRGSAFSDAAVEGSVVDVAPLRHDLEVATMRVSSGGPPAPLR